jgi:hypothetical protein
MSRENRLQNNELWQSCASLNNRLSRTLYEFRAAARTVAAKEVA